MATPLFEVEDLHVQTVASSGETPIPILKGVTITVMPGEIHALIGPNGSGKSTLAKVLMGSPLYEVTSGAIRLHGDDITDWGTDVRAKAGLFLAFQHPQELPGVSVISFLRHALSARKGIEIGVSELTKVVTEWIDKLEMNPAFIERPFNFGFSVGERKRNEILQMALLEPEMAVLDETDSGLDVRSLRTVANGIQHIRSVQPQLGTLLITHYKPLLDNLNPDVVHVLVDGKVTKTGGAELAVLVDELAETEGYEGLNND